MNKIDKILKLAEKTGDKIIMTNPDGSESFVIMPFNDYEKIVKGQEDVRNLSERELWNQIDRDINLWKAEHEDYNDPFRHDEFDQDELKDFDLCCDVEDCVESEECYRNDGWLDDTEDSHEDEEEYDLPADATSLQAGVDDLIPEFDEHEAQEEGGFEFEEIDDDFETNEDEENFDPKAIEEKIIEDQIEEEIQKKSRFAIPEERLAHANEKTPISYEDISDETKVNVEDLINNEQENEKVIDMSFSEEDVPENF